MKKNKQLHSQQHVVWKVDTLRVYYMTPFILSLRKSHWIWWLESMDEIWEEKSQKVMKTKLYLQDQGGENGEEAKDQVPGVSDL